MNFTKE
jgi:hypothetical protein